MQLLDFNKINLINCQFYDPDTLEAFEYIGSNFVKPNPYIKIPKYLGLKSKVFEPLETDFLNLKWKEIIFIEYHLRSFDSNPKGMNEIIKMLYQISDKDIYRVNYFNMFGVVKFINNEIIRIFEIKKNSLRELKHSKEWKGIEGMEYMIELDKLSNGDILKEEKILELKYYDIINKLKVVNRVDYNSQLNEKL